MSFGEVMFSGSDYNEMMAGYLDEQWTFQNVDLVDGKGIPFTNVYDKDYRPLVLYAGGKGNSWLLSRFMQNQIRDLEAPTPFSPHPSHLIEEAMKGQLTLASNLESLDEGSNQTWIRTCFKTRGSLGHFKLLRL